MFWKRQTYTKHVTTFSDSPLRASNLEGWGRVDLFLRVQHMLYLETSYTRGHVDGMSLKWEPFFIMSCKGVKYQSQERQVYSNEYPDNFEME